jgi:hypothetical protein
MVFYVNLKIEMINVKVKICLLLINEDGGKVSE